MLQGVSIIELTIRGILLTKYQLHMPCLSQAFLIDIPLTSVETIISCNNLGSSIAADALANPVAHASAALALICRL